MWNTYRAALLRKASGDRLTRSEARAFESNALHMVDPMRREALMLTSRKGERLKGTDYTLIYDNGVAVLDIHGPIFRHADSMDTSGAMSTNEVFAELRAIKESNNVKSAILYLDTPGGDATASDTVAQYIRDLGKPIECYAEGLCASLGYYWASATRRITMGRMSMAGSIGVVIGVPLPDGKTKFGDNVLVDEEGHAVAEIVSSVSPLKRADPTSEEGHAYFLRIVNGLADVFVADVGRFRGLDASQLPAQYGDGGVYPAAACLEMGLCDEVDSFETVLTRMTDEDWERGSSMTGSPGPEQPAAAEEAGAKPEGQTEGGSDVGLREFLGKPKAAAATPPKSEGGLPVSEVLAHLETQRGPLIERFGPEAASWAATVVADSKAWPAEQFSLAARFVNAKVIDALFATKAVYFTAEGDEVEGTYMEALESEIELRPKHTLAEERVEAVQSGKVKGTALAEHQPESTRVVTAGEYGDDSMSKEAVMKSSPAGRAAAAQSGNSNGAK